MIDSINECFQTLIRIGFVFDSIEYVEPLKLLSSHGKWATQGRVLEELILNKVSLDPLMIQKALEGFFSKIDDKDGDAQDCIMRIT
jgi:hypothetical protein